MCKLQPAPSIAADDLSVLEQAERQAIQSLSADGAKNTGPQRSDALDKVHAVIVKRLDLGLATDG